MAKGKTTNSSKAQSTSASKRNSTAANNGESPVTATQAGRELSPIAIGHVAGQIWGVLSDNGEQTLAALKKSVDAPPDTVMAAIGWLAREDKLLFNSSGRTVKIALR